MYEVHNIDNAILSKYCLTNCANATSNSVRWHNY